MRRRDFIVATGALALNSGSGLSQKTKSSELVKSYSSGTQGVSSPGPRPIAPRGEIRTLVMLDLSSFARPPFFSDPASPNQIRRLVDNFALSGADVFGQEVFAQGWTLHYRSSKYEYDARPQHRRWMSMLDSGVNPIEVFIDQAHKRGMKFVAGVRINDDHGAPSQGARWIHDHPQWKLQQMPPGRLVVPGNTLDFTFPEVRTFYFGAVKEIVQRFDVDGIELTFRSANHFPYPRSISRKRQPLMTELIERIKAMLKEHEGIRNRPLLLGVRVPQTLEECHDCGLDIPAWIAKDLITYVSPGDCMFSDLNAPYEEFYSLTRGKQCRLFPGIQPYLCNGDRTSHPMSIENYRAVAMNMYGAGADGVSLYNPHMQLGSGYVLIANYPQGLTYLRELRDPGTISAAPRLYMFRPAWNGDIGFEKPGATNTGAIKDDKIVLSRAQPYVRGGYRFRLCEDLKKVTKAYLFFRAIDLRPEETLRVDVNGVPIAEDSIDRLWDNNGRSANFGRKLPPYSTLMFELSREFTKDGDNELGVRIDRYDTERGEDIIIDEIDISVIPILAPVS